jgi:hypothetical protein
MKNAMLLLLAAILLQSCENIESNSVALQANVESNFFKAYSAYGIMDEDNLSVTITGLTDSQELVLHTSWRGQKKYELGPEFDSYAMFKDADGNEYHTNSEGSSGSITITNRSDIRNEVSGKFNFECVLPGKDTIVVHNGLFYAVPFTMQTIGED